MCGAEDWTQSFTPVRQVHDHMRYILSPENSLLLKISKTVQGRKCFPVGKGHLGVPPKPLLVSSICCSLTGKLFRQCCAGGGSLYSQLILALENTVVFSAG